jgi:hypothetical protein
LDGDLGLDGNFAAGPFGSLLDQSILGRLCIRSARAAISITRRPARKDADFGVGQTPLSPRQSEAGDRGKELRRG